MKIRDVMKQAVSTVEIPKSVNLLLNSTVKKFKLLFDKIFKHHLIEDVFIGGSYAKKTMINKQQSDVDFFIRFKHDVMVSESIMSSTIRQRLKRYVKNLKKIGVVKIEEVHGSRDYFILFVNKNVNIMIEIIPIIKIRKSSEAENITDISPLHVAYIKKQIRNKPALKREIKLAKAFFNANGCYGAETFIQGFSGYSLEILVSHYGSFIRLCKAISKWKPKVYIDPEHYYKSKTQAMKLLNHSKIISPVILIDPVQKERNVTAAVGNETFKKISKVCKNFLKKPSIGYFTKHETNLSVILKKFLMLKKKDERLFMVKFRSIKKRQDIAAVKCKKFVDYLSVELRKITKFHSFFAFDKERMIATVYLLLPKQIVMVKQGPPVIMKEQSVIFRKKHKNKGVYIKKSRLYAKSELRSYDILKQLLKKAKEMTIKDVRVKIK